MDIKTGDEIWRISSIPGAHDSYCTPVVIPNNGRPAVLFTTYHHGFAHDVETGERLWMVKIPLEQPVPDFVADDDTAYLTGGIHAPAAAAAIRLEGKGDVTESHVDWKITKGITGVSSPVLYEGLLYWIT